MGRSVRGFEKQWQELIVFFVFWSGDGTQATLSFRSLLIRVEEARLSRRRKRSFTFISNRALSMIDAYNCYADRIATASLELDDLISKVVDDPVYLLNHGLG